MWRAGELCAPFRLAWGHCAFVAIAPHPQCTYLLIHFDENQDLKICRNPYTIKCYDYESLPQKLLKEKIPCSTDKDCLNLSEFCTPGIPTLANCIGFDIFCGKDNTCKGCCPESGS